MDAIQVFSKKGKETTLSPKPSEVMEMQNNTKMQSWFPRSNDYEHALSIDKNDGNNEWAESIELNIDQQHYCDTCKEMGKGPSPEGHKLILVHFVFDVKHDGRHEGRLVADGHTTDVPLSSVYSRVVSLRGIRLVLFVAVLNRLDSLGTDIGNACLESFTKEKVCIKAGREFGPLEVHTLIINKASCGICTSGLL